MDSKRQDRITALIMLAFAIVWSATVYMTVPTASIEGQIGPREFPLMLGLILAFVSILLLLKSLVPGTGGSQTEPDADSQDSPQRVEGAAFAAWVFGLIVFYGFLMDKTGFLIATPVVVAATLAGVLRVRNPVLILGFAAGITAGCWLLFNKLLGIYLPSGSWVTLF